MKAGKDGRFVFHDFGFLSFCFVTAYRFHSDVFFKKKKKKVVSRKSFSGINGKRAKEKRRLLKLVSHNHQIIFGKLSTMGMGLIAEGVFICTC